MSYLALNKPSTKTFPITSSSPGLSHQLDTIQIQEASFTARLVIIIVCITTPHSFKMPYWLPAFLSEFVDLACANLSVHDPNPFFPFCCIFISSGPPTCHIHVWLATTLSFLLHPSFSFSPFSFPLSFPPYQPTHPYYLLSPIRLQHSCG